MVPEALQRFARAAADFATHGKLGNLEFARDARGRPDVAAFDFTSMMRAESAARVQEKHGARLLLGLVGDCLVEVSISGGSGGPMVGEEALLWESRKSAWFGEELRGYLVEVKAVWSGKGIPPHPHTHKPWRYLSLGHNHWILIELFSILPTLQPFWPLGTGVARGFLAAFDAAWMVKRWAEGAKPLEVLAER